MHSYYLLIFLFSVSLLFSCKPKDSTPSPPNILFIMADDLGYGDLGSYGQQVIQTPYLDRLAAQGMRFTQCYAGSPVCAPSRSVLMTGKHTGHTTVRGNFGKYGVEGLGGGQGRVPLESADITVAEVLKEARYVTGITGKWGLGEPHTTGHPNEQGFDEWMGYLNQRRAHSYYPEYLWSDKKKIMLEGNENGGTHTYSHDLFTQFALEFVERHKDTSFFLYLPYTIPHDRYEIPDTQPYTEEEWEPDEKVHAAMITRLDGDIGKLMELLDQLGLTQNTLVFFCSDNGAARRWEGRFDSSGSLKGRKRDLYEGGIRTPMIARLPGKISAGTTSDFPWYFADVLPTLAEVAGVSEPEGIDGVSVWPTLTGKKQDETNRNLYWEFYERGYQQAVRMGKWKGVKLSVEDPWELYNLEEDEAESRNIAPLHPDTVAIIAEWAQQQHVESRNWPVDLKNEN